MHEFENELIRGIYISRYVGSWLNVSYPIEHTSRSRNKYGLFIAWLRQLVIDGEHLTEDEVWRIYNFATNGKLELQENAKKFVGEVGF